MHGSFQASGPFLRISFAVFFLLIPGYVGYVAVTQKDPLVEFGIQVLTGLVSVYSAARVPELTHRRTCRTQVEHDDMGAWRRIFGKPDPKDNPKDSTEVIAKGDGGGASGTADGGPR